MKNLLALVRNRSPEPLPEAALKGVAAGIAGTAILSLSMAYMPVVLQQLGMAPEPERPSGAPGQADRPRESPPERLAETVSERVAGTTLGPDARKAAGQTIHWGYGAVWGAVYGLAQSRLRLPHLVHGTVFGLLVAVVASTLVPAAGLAPAPTEQSAAKSATQLFNHLLYGWVTALTYHFLSERN